MTGHHDPPNWEPAHGRREAADARDAASPPGPLRRALRSPTGWAVIGGVVIAALLVAVASGAADRWWRSGHGIAETASIEPGPADSLSWTRTGYPPTAYGAGEIWTRCEIGGTRLWLTTGPDGNPVGPAALEPATAIDPDTNHAANGCLAP